MIQIGKPNIFLPQTNASDFKCLVIVVKGNRIKLRFEALKSNLLSFCALAQSTTITIQCKNYSAKF